MTSKYNVHVLALVSFLTFTSAQADQSCTTMFGLGHRYHVGDRVLAKFAGDYCDATIEDVTPDCKVKVRYDSWSRNIVDGDTYKSALFDIEPANFVKGYKPLLSTHTYRVGDRVLARFAGDLAPATIDAITSDGRVRVTFDSWSMNIVDGGTYQNAFWLSQISGAPERAVASNQGKNSGDQTPGQSGSQQQITATGGVAK